MVLQIANSIVFKHIRFGFLIWYNFFSGILFGLIMPVTFGFYEMELCPTY